MSSLSLDNSDRQHLTPAQRAVIAVKHTEMLEHGGDRKSEQIESQEYDLKTRTEVAKYAGVSKRTIDNAKKALEVAPEKANVSRHV